VLGCKEFYDKTAARWAENGYSDEAEPVCMDEFCALLPPGGRVLDLCCGAGYESFRLRRRGFEPVGLDFSGESLAIAREKNPGVSFLQGDMLESYCRIGAVDGVVCIAGLVHVETADLPLAFRRVAEVLKPGGYLLASVRYGTGRMEERSVTEIDGETYDRNFIAHNEAELSAAMGEAFTLVGELPSAMKIWAYYLFQKKEEVRV
jgi:SAM-dependent methyltransferase